MDRQFDDGDDSKDQDATPRGLHDAWRFTPSLLDTNSFTFASFANQPPGYYTPTPGGMNTLYHSQAGDLHTPSMGLHLGTPLSLSLSEGPLQAESSIVDMHGFHSHMFHPNSFQQPDPYSQQQSYAPSSFVHQDSGYEAVDGSPGNEIGMETEMPGDSTVAPFQARDMRGIMAAPPLPYTEK